MTDILNAAVPATLALGAEVRETHSAVVFFFGDRAYKVKKPVDLGFLDFSTPQARRAVCHREVELNRRLAPDVYLGVSEVSDESGQPCEWLVVMRRMPAGRRLSELIRRGEPVERELRMLARMLSVFHAKALHSADIDRAGGMVGLRARWRDNIEGLAPFRGGPLDPSSVDELADRAQRYLAGREPMFAERVASGLICDGHGDLLTDDIFCLPDGPRVLDCLEFDDHLRWVDGLDDAAFLAMDLERLGQRELAERFLGYYTEFSGHRRVVSLEHHYVAYRAVVRAKVACLRFAQGATEQGDQARDLTALALRHLRAGEPRLVLVGGLPGTGKSTLAGRLADELGAVRLRSDLLRKELGRRDADQAATAAWDSGLYAPETTGDIYRDLLERARRLLERGETVILDASWSDQEERGRARAVAAATSSTITELCCQAPSPVAAQRIRSRAGTGDPSDATPAIADHMAQRFASWPQAIPIDTAASVDESTRAALDAW